MGCLEGPDRCEAFKYYAGLWINQVVVITGTILLPGLFQEFFGIFQEFLEFSRNSRSSMNPVPTTGYFLATARTSCNYFDNYNFASGHLFLRTVPLSWIFVYLLFAIASSCLHDDQHYFFSKSLPYSRNSIHSWQVSFCFFRYSCLSGWMRFEIAIVRATPLSFPIKKKEKMLQRTCRHNQNSLVLGTGY